MQVGVVDADNPEEDNRSQDMLLIARREDSSRGGLIWAYA
jgi:hypothetical protein